MDGLLNYLDEQIDAIRLHATAALEAFDEKAVHQARVATRRLKAGLELLSPLINKADKHLGRAGKKLRRRLGPLRDLDVMIGLVADQKPAPALAGAVEWLSTTLTHQRRDARLDDHDAGAKPTKFIGRFDAWWKIRHDLERDIDAISPLLTAAVHDRFEKFAEQANWISGIVALPEDSPPIDVHQVRIEGKALRYTLEMADAGGVKLPKKVIKTFKSMQESLGDWHDYVVLYERTLSLIVAEELALHAPQLAGPTLDLAKQFLSRSITALAAFRSQWKKSGTDLAAALAEGVPLLAEPIVNEPDADETSPQEPPAEELSDEESPEVPADESVTEPQTDLDPSSTETIEPSELVPEAFEPPTPE